MAPNGIFSLTIAPVHIAEYYIRLARHIRAHARTKKFLFQFESCYIQYFMKMIIDIRRGIIEREYKENAIKERLYSLVSSKHAFPES